MAEKISDDEFMKQLKKRVRDEFVATGPPERQIAYADEERASARAAEQRRLNREAVERQQAELKEARRAEAESAFGQEIRNRFFANHPYATQADFARLWPRLRDEAMLRISQTGANVEAERRNPRYNF